MLISGRRQIKVCVKADQKYLAITRLDSNNTRRTIATINSEIAVGSGVMKTANAISAP